MNERLILHLSEMDRHKDEPDVPVGASQEGIAQRLGTGVHTVSRMLSSIVKEGLVSENGRDRYTVASAARSSGEKTYEIVVEKIYPNGAVVVVNDKWRARLTPEEYNGPKALIKKNSRFRAAADLYRMGGTLCIRVNEVVEKLD